MVCHKAIHLVCPISQVVSDYLTAFDDPAMMMQAGGKPVVVYTYRCGAHAGQEWCLGGGGRCGRLQAREQAPASGMPCCRFAVKPSFPPVAKVAPPHHPFHSWQHGVPAPSGSGGGRCSSRARSGSTGGCSAVAAAAAAATEHTYVNFLSIRYLIAPYYLI